MNSASILTAIKISTFSGTIPLMHFKCHWKICTLAPVLMILRLCLIAGAQLLPTFTWFSSRSSNSLKWKSTRWLAPCLGYFTTNSQMCASHSCFFESPMSGWTWWRNNGWVLITFLSWLLPGMLCIRLASIGEILSGQLEWRQRIEIYTHTLFLDLSFHTGSHLNAISAFFRGLLLAKRMGWCHLWACGSIYLWLSPMHELWGQQHHRHWEYLVTLGYFFTAFVNFTPLSRENLVMLFLHSPSMNQPISEQLYPGLWHSWWWWHCCGWWLPTINDHIPGTPYITSPDVMWLLEQSNLKPFPVHPLHFYFLNSMNSSILMLNAPLYKSPSTSIHTREFLDNFKLPISIYHPGLAPARPYLSWTSTTVCGCGYPTRFLDVYPQRQCFQRYFKRLSTAKLHCPMRGGNMDIFCLSVFVMN